MTRWDEITWTIESFPDDPDDPNDRNFACLSTVEDSEQFEQFAVIGRFHMPFQITLVEIED